jgi:hypothetical protein
MIWSSWLCVSDGRASDSLSGKTFCSWKESQSEREKKFDQVTEPDKIVFCLSHGRLYYLTARRLFLFILYAPHFKQNSDFIAVFYCRKYNGLFGFRYLLPLLWELWLQTHLALGVLKRKGVSEFDTYQAVWCVCRCYVNADWKFERHSKRLKFWVQAVYALIKLQNLFI